MSAIVVERDNILYIVYCTVVLRTDEIFSFYDAFMIYYRVMFLRISLTVL